VTRDELNELAREAGIESPEKLPNKGAVEEAIEEAEKDTLLREVSVVDAVEADLRRIAERDPELVRSGLAATAFALARDLDNPKNSATSKSMCAKALSDVLDRLLELAPEAPKKDKIDDLSARRAARRAAA
jgi:hypothetical protein